MNAEALLEYSNIVAWVMSLSLLTLLLWRKMFTEYPWLTVLLCIRAIADPVQVSLLFFRRSLHIPLSTAYPAYFYTCLIVISSETLFAILIIYSVFRLAMKPMEGLHQMGKVIFRWVAAVSIATSLGVAIGPHLFSAGFSATAVVTNVYAQIQQATSVLILCLLLFVSFAIRPLGMTFRSHIFGITLGLGITAAANLVQSAWFSTVGAHSLYSAIYLVSALGTCGAQIVWFTYFALPDPERKMILLPTTSPFFFWNKVSEALGDNPGYVAVAGFRPEMLAPAELKMLSAASANARARRLSAELVPPSQPSVVPLPTVAYRA